MDPDPDAAARVLSAIGEEDYGRLLAALVTRFRDFDLAEEALHDAVLRAVETWSGRGSARTPSGVADGHGEEPRHRSHPLR